MPYPLSAVRGHSSPIVLPGVYLLNDLWSPDLNPLTTPRTSSPGPGSLQIVQPVTNYTESGGLLTIPVNAGNWTHGIVWNGTGHARGGGFGIICGLNATITWKEIIVGLATSQTIAFAAFANLSDSFYYDASVPGQLSVLSGSVQTVVVTGQSRPNLFYHSIVTRSKGAFYFMKGGTFTQWTLVMITGRSTGNSLFPAIGNKSFNGVSNALKSVQFTGLLASDYGIASVHKTAVNAGDETATSDQITSVTITAPTVLAGTAGLLFRKNIAGGGVGGDGGTANFDKLWFNSAGALLYQQFIGGVGQGSPVTLASGVIAGAATVTILVRGQATAIDSFSVTGFETTSEAITVRGSTQTDSTNQGNPLIQAFADTLWTSGGGSLGTLNSYPTTASVYDATFNPFL